MCEKRSSLCRSLGDKKDEIMRNDRVLSAEEDANSCSSSSTASLSMTNVVICSDSQTSVTSSSTVGEIASSPLTPLAGFKYNWHQSVHDSVLPVRCKNTSGELHKDKFGSGGRGRCIRVGSEWYTPSEFEVKCGRGNSKDWKRSIRYGGRTLQCLIEEGLLQPHATSCTCSACCDDNTVTGPVRLFVPYKRRKKDGDISPQLTIPVSEDCPVANSLDTSGVVILTPSATEMSSPKNTIQVVTADGTILGTTASDTPVFSLNTPQLKPSSLAFNFNEEKQWWYLEEAINNLISNANQIKLSIQQIKEQSRLTRETAINELKLQLEKEKVFNFTTAVDNSDQTDYKRCANCNREAFSECTGCHNVSYCTQFCQQKDWANHHSECRATNNVSLHEVDLEKSK